MAKEGKQQNPSIRFVNACAILKNRGTRLNFNTGSDRVDTGISRETRAPSAWMVVKALRLRVCIFLIPNLSLCTSLPIHIAWNLLPVNTLQLYFEPLHLIVLLNAQFPNQHLLE